MAKPSGIHHIAISTADMKSQIEFFSDVLGMELIGLFWMHGVKDAWHGFMKMGDYAFAFVFLPKNRDAQTVIGQTHSGSGAGASAPGTLQHLALNVDTYEELLEMRDRIRSRGVPCFGPINHGLCQSIYFAGLEGMSLEVATNDCDNPLDTDGSWVDQEVVELAGISHEELARYRSPEPFKATEGAGSVKQPTYRSDKPHLVLGPHILYRLALHLPDSMTGKSNPEYAKPPNKKGDE